MCSCSLMPFFVMTVKSWEQYKTDVEEAADKVTLSTKNDRDTHRLIPGRRKRMTLSKNGNFTEIEKGMEKRVTETV